MIILKQNQSLEVEVSTGEDIDAVASFVHLGAGVFEPDSSELQVTAIGSEELIAEPALAQQIQVKALSFTNVGIGENTVRIKKIITGPATRYLTPPVLLSPGESLQFLDGDGWHVHDALGRRREESTSEGGFSGLLFPPFFFATSVGTTSLGVGGVNVAQYMGRAPYPLLGEALSARVNVTTAAGTITWSEACVLTGTIVPGGDPTLTVVGFADTSAIFNSIGLQDVSIPITEDVEYGADLWLGFGNLAVTSAVLRSGNQTDDLALRTRANRTVQPSTVVGTPEVYTGASVTQLWVGLFFP